MGAPRAFPVPQFGELTAGPFDATHWCIETDVKGAVMLSVEDQDELEALAEAEASALLAPAGPITDMRLRFDVHVALRQTLLKARIPASRLTPDWAPKDDFDEDGWPHQIAYFQKAIHARNPAYAAYVATPNHAGDTRELKLPKAEDYLVERVRAVL
jgi:hypothetical protein